MIFLKLKKFIFSKTVIVTPSCPICGSTATGHIINASTDYNIIKKKKLYMAKGEYIKPRYYSGMYNNTNVFCLHCGNEWLSDEIAYIRMSHEELSDLKKKILIWHDHDDDYANELITAYMNGCSLEKYLSDKDNDSRATCMSRKNRRKEKVKKIAAKVWGSIIVSSTVGVFTDLIKPYTKNNVINIEETGENIEE